MGGIKDLMNLPYHYLRQVAEDPGDVQRLDVLFEHHRRWRNRLLDDLLNILFCFSLRHNCDVNQRSAIWVIF